MTENRFNLVDEKWIPVAGMGRASLRDVFSDSTLTELAGNPIEKISAFKLLLAIAQAACPLKDEDEWERLGEDGVRQKVLKYLDEKHECFWLYGEHPFLQFPQLAEYGEDKIRELREFQIGTEGKNTTVVTEIQAKKSFLEEEKVMLLLVEMGFSRGGSKVNSLTNTKKGKGSAGKPGICLGKKGYVHSFIQKDNILKTVWVNLLTEAQIQEFEFYPRLGIPPWEKMPETEDCISAEELKTSYMGRLIPINRKILYKGSGILYADGIRTEDSGDAWIAVDPTVSTLKDKKEIKFLYVDPDKRPWRELPAMLSILDDGKGYACRQINITKPRLRKMGGDFDVWSGGVRYSSNSGEPYISGNDDFVSSKVSFSTEVFGEKSQFFENFKKQMELLNNMSRHLFSSGAGYYRTLKEDKKLYNKQAGDMCRIFWQRCEKRLQDIISICSEEDGAVREKRQAEGKKKIKAIVRQIYNESCPKVTARQMEAWAMNAPFSSKEE